MAALAFLVPGSVSESEPPAPGVVPSVDTVTCVPGGVAAVPLERNGDAAVPARVSVVVGALRSQAPVVWVGARPDDGARFWTRSPEQVEAAMACDLPADPRPESTGQLFAMVELPSVGEGDLEVAGRPVRARWLPSPQRLRSDAPLLSVAATPSEDRPDPTTPVEYWRWSLLAERSGARIGDPRGDAADRLWARHVESLWAAGLERVRTQSRGMHAEVVDALVGLAEDLEGRRSVAAWVARPRELRTLLGILVDTERTDADAAQAALTWSRTRWIVTAWIEEDAGDRKQHAVANPSAGERGGLPRRGGTGHALDRDHHRPRTHGADRKPCLRQLEARAPAVVPAHEARADTVVAAGAHLQRPRRGDREGMRRRRWIPEPHDDLVEFGFGRVGRAQRVDEELPPARAPAQRR
ncbi:MAG: hypothetical protein ACKORL_06405 [Phycisphaerales bacterium]